MKVKEFIINALEYSIPTVVSAVLSILAIPIITRIYPAEDYGKINMFYSVGVMLASLFMLGLQNACIRFFYEPLEGSDKIKVFNLTFSVGIFITFVCSIVSVLFLDDLISYYLFGEDNKFALILFFLYVFANIYFKLQCNYTRLSLNANGYNKLQIIYIFINKVLFAVTVFISTDYIYSITFIVAGTLLEVLFFGKKYYRFSMSFPKITASKRMLVFSLPLLPSEIAVMLNNLAAKMILSYYGDFYTLGVISMATSLANTYTIVTQGFGLYWGTFMYAHYKDENQLIKKVHNYILMLSGLIVGIIFIIQDILYMILGSSYRTSQPYFMLIMLLPVMSMIMETTSYGINISKKTIISLVISIISCIVNIFICFILYPKIGVTAMALGIGGSAIIRTILQTYFGQKYYNSIVNTWQTVYGILLITIICGLNLVLFNNFKLRLLIFIISYAVTLTIFKNEIYMIYKKLLNYIVKIIKQ